MRTKWLALMLVLASGCPDVKTDAGQTQGQLPPVDGPTVEFDPGHAIVPFPSNFVLDPTTGRVNIPAQACETPTAMALRTNVLNTLDGFGTFEAAMQVTFTAPVDATTLSGHVVMYERAKGTTPIDPSSAQQVPIVVMPGTTLRFDAADCTMPAKVDAVTIVPTVPLDEHSTYTIALLSGIKTADGQDYLPSGAWALVRQAQDPVTLADGCNPTTLDGCVVTANQTPIDPSTMTGLAQIVGIDTLWKASAPAMTFLAGAGQMPGDVLVAWDYTTQTTTDPLDPMVANSPAANLPAGALVGTKSVVPPGGCSAATGCTAFLSAVLPAGTCNSLPCQAVGDVLGAGLFVADDTYQTHVSNPLPGGADIPGPWSDPYSPTLQSAFAGPIGAGLLEVIAVVPNATTPAAGWPVVVFGHGLGSAKETMLAIAPQLAAAGFASVAIDFVDHGSRAVRTSVDPMLGCGPGTCSTTMTQTCDPTAPTPTGCPMGESCVGAPDPTVVPQCYAPFLSTDLATTRDNIRETVLDLQRLVKAVRTCGPSGCGELSIDPAHVVYAGISLGGIIGSTTTAVEQDFQGAVLNVSGVGLVDILENTPNLEIRCTLVNGLIDAGVLVGQKWDPSNPTVGLCTTPDWKDPAMQPGYAQFASAARWILDPADGANFTAKLATKRFLLQEVVNDQVVPNIASDDEGKLTGLTPAMADLFTPATPAPPTGASAAIKAAPTSNLWLRYQDVAGTSTMFGNLFQHASLLAPVASPGQCSNDPATACTSSADCAGNPCVFPGALGTARVQTDAITYLLANH